MSLFKSSIIVSLWTFLSRIFGYIRDILIASSLGTSVLSDIYVMAFTFPNFFRRLFGEGALLSAFIPFYTSKLDQKEEAKKFADNIFSILLVVLLAITIIAEIYMPQMVEIFAPGLTKDEYTFALATFLSRISMPYLVFICLVSLLGGILNCYGRYAAAAFSPVLLNVCMIIGITLSVTLNLFETTTHGLAYGILIAGVVQYVAIYYSLKKAGLSVNFTMPKFDSEFKSFALKMVPGLISGGIFQINVLIDRRFASLAGEGSNAILYLSDRIIQLPLSLIGIAIGTVLLPVLAKDLKTGNKEKVHQDQNNALKASIFLTLPCVAALCFYSVPIVNILFEHGEFRGSDTIKVSHALIAAGIGLPAYILIKIITPCFFANFDTKTPIKIALFAIFVNLVLNIIFLEPLKYIGVALATSLAGWVNIILLFFIALKKGLLRIDIQTKHHLVKTLLLSLIISLICFLAEKLYIELISYSFSIKLAVFFITSFLLAIIYLTLSNIFAVYTLRDLKLLFKKA